MSDESLASLLSRLGGLWIAPAAPKPTVPKGVGDIPEEYRWARFDAPEIAQRCVPAEAERVKRCKLDMVLLVGSPRAGKTSLGSALFRHHLETHEGARGAWIAAVELCQTVTRESRLGDEPAILRRARAAAVLLLDDLGQEGSDEASRVTITELLVKRHATHRRTIVTTGLSEALLAERYGGGLHRRLTEKGRANVVVLKGRQS